MNKDTIQEKSIKEDILPSAQLSALCHLMNSKETTSNKAQICARIIQTTSFSSRYTKPTAWVYDCLYDKTPIGLIFSPTTGLSFYLPIKLNGHLSFKEACYLDKSFSQIKKTMRSGNSVLASDIGNTTPLPNTSLAGWIERALGHAEQHVQ